jgi:hypothetical protein
MTTVGDARKTREEKNDDNRVLYSSRKIPRITKGNYDWPKVEKELKERGCGIQDGAKKYFEKQKCSPKNRKIMVIRTDETHVTRCLRFMISGRDMPNYPTAEQIKASRAKRSATLIGRNLGQLHVWEAAAFKAFASLPIFEQYEVRHLMDGRGADKAIRLKGTDDNWTLLQIKSGTYNDHRVQFGVKKSDGLSGGKYEHFAILALAFAEPDRVAARQATEYDHIPDVELVYAIFFSNASLMPGKHLAPYKSTDLGDNRVWFGSDNKAKNDRFVKLLHTGIEESSKHTLEQANFSCGAGSCNSNILEINEHYQEVLNGRVLARLVGMDALSAPLSQNQAIDIVWHMKAGDRIRISLKTASIHHGGKYGGYKFDLKKAPGAVHCDVVMAFYKDEQGLRTHLSVLSARRVYVRNKNSFCWSYTSNEDVLENRICLQSEGLLEQIHQAMHTQMIQRI